MSLQLQAFSAALQKRFEFNEQEMKSLTETYRFRSEPLNEKNIIPTIWDGALKLLGKSSSNYVLQKLKSRSIDVIFKHFGYLEQSLLERRAHSLSTFVLDYLTTLNRICIDGERDWMNDVPQFRNVTQMPVSDYQLQLHGLHEIGIDEFIDKGISWDGNNLSELELADIFRAIRVKIPAVRVMLGEISSLRYIKLDPELQALKDALLAKDLREYIQLQLLTSADARLYSGPKNDVYDKLKEMRVYYNELVKLHEQILLLPNFQEIEKEFCD